MILENFFVIIFTKERAIINVIQNDDFKNVNGTVAMYYDLT